MSFNAEDLKWVNEANRHPHAYVFKIEFIDGIGEEYMTLIDDYTGETVYIFSENIYYFINQLLNYYGFKTEE